MRTSQKHADELAALRATRAERPEPTPPWVHEGAVRAVLGGLTDTLKPCAGDCGDRLVKYSDWKALEKAKRKRLRGLGLNRLSARDRCWKCAEQDKENGVPRRTYYGSKVTAEMKAQIPEIWAEIQTDGGATPELGRRLGVTRERARQLVKELGLPHRDRRIERSEIFLEELHHLVSLGLGVYELSKALNIPCDSLVRKVDNLRHNGKTTVSFPGYFSTVFDGAEDGNFREEWEEVA